MLNKLTDIMRIIIFVFIFYISRHSWATIAKNEGIPISLISEGLGHTSEKTTQIYLASFPVDAVNRVNESVAAAVGNCIKKGGGISSV